MVHGVCRRGKGACGRAYEVRANALPSAMIAAGSADDFNGDGRDARLNHADSLGGSAGQIYDAAAGERSAVIDAHDDATAICGVGDAYFGAEGECAMCGGQGVLVEPLAIGSKPAMKTRAIPGGYAVAGIGEGGWRQADHGGEEREGENFFDDHGELPALLTISGQLVATCLGANQV